MENTSDKDKQVRSEVDRIDGLQLRERIPFGVPQSSSGVRFEIPGYFLRWIDDLGGRIEKAIEGWYQFVTKKEVGITDAINGDLGDRVSRVVGTNRQTGGGYRSYLMKLPNELREADKKILSDRRELRMNSIKQGLASPVDRNFYVPKDTPISISSKKP